MWHINFDRTQLPYTINLVSRFMIILIRLAQLIYHCILLMLPNLFITDAETPRTGSCRSVAVGLLSHHPGS